MRRWWLLLAALALWPVRSGQAQPRVVLPAKPTPVCRIVDGSLVLNSTASQAEHGEALPAGTPVSQPLQPVELVEEPPPDPASIPSSQNDVVIIPATEPVGPLGQSWDSFEFLLWWPKSQPIPPLVAANRFAPPIPGMSGTNILVGGRSLGGQDQAGGRFVLGQSLNASQTVGLEGIYFFLGTRTTRATVNDIAEPRLVNIGFPYFDPVAGTPAALTVSRRGFSTAQFDVSASTRIQGAEMNLVTSLLDDPRVKVRGLAGYRFFQLQEGLRNEAMIVNFPTPDGTPTSLSQVADQFDAHNRFSGGQLGLAMDMSRGVVFVEFVGKVALGSNFEVVKVQGQTNTFVGYQPLGLATSYPSGVYSQPSNIGRFTRSAFAVVPEAMVKIGLKLNDHGRFFAAYNFLYLSDAVRPGDQVDGTVNGAQIRLLNPAGTTAGPDRPTPLFNRTDFWVQGLVLGLEGRY